MKLVNMSDSKSDALKSLRVQVPPSAQLKSEVKPRFFVYTSYSCNGSGIITSSYEGY